MRDIGRAALAIVFAFLFYSILVKISLTLALVLNVFSVVVIYFAVSKGEIFGSVTGMLCGFIQDSFTLGVFGVAGIAKTLLGFFAGMISKRIHVASLWRRFVFSFVLLLGELLIWLFLYTNIYSEQISYGGGWLFFEPILTAALASAAFPFVDWIDSLLEKRKQ